MTDKKDTPNLVAFPCTKPTEVPVKKQPNKHVVDALETMLQLAKDGDLVHLVACYELLDGNINASYSGISGDYFKMYYTLDKVLNYNYETTYIMDISYE